MNVGVGIYTGGNPYTSGVPYAGSATEQLFSDLGTAGYDTAVLWAAHIGSDGAININDCSVIANGAFVAAAQPWADQVSVLRRSGAFSSLRLSIGGDSTSFANIKALMNQYGVSRSNPLYVGLSILKQALSLDGVDYDDESEYDSDSSAALAALCAELGLVVSFCPFTYESYWVDLATTINAANLGTVDAIFLQCYSGGAGNDPAQWNKVFAPTGLTVSPGLWATHQVGDPPSCSLSTTATQAGAQMAEWVAGTALAGGWMFVGTDMQACPNGGTPADYATQIRSGLQGQG